MANKAVEKGKPGEPSPSDIKQVNASTLGITWSDGHESVYPVKLLREK